ncbi:MAG: hypothetical protein PHQ65_12025 [Bacteroidales bacterium]|nr:hypothetical protein [Bacteroidales bacterium]MDD3665985.1 hypothetical protein [Bacteroidales bacterium]
MDYKEKIKSAIERANQNLAFDRKLRDEAIEAFKKREQEEEEPIRLLIQQYLDEELKDINGNTIREGYIIVSQNNYPAYKVIKRGMQFLFGTPLFSPSVQVVSYSPTKEPKFGKKVKTLHRSELSKMVIMFDDGAS